MTDHSDFARPPRPNPRFDFTDAVPSAAGLGRVHFVGIGGSGVAGVAEVLHGLGVPVTGSDALASHTTEEVAEAGITVHVGHDAAHLGDADTVVISGAVRETNPELALARERGLRVLHRAQALSAVTSDRPSAAVAGASGKTTTTAMLVTVMQAAGLDPSFAVGGEVTALGRHGGAGAGGTAVVEADESDLSFTAYRPTVALVLNVTPDHLDFYEDFVGVKAGYAAFARSVRAGGLLVACADDEGARALAAAMAAEGRRTLTYGQSGAADVRLVDVVLDGLHASGRLVTPGGEHTLELPMPGIYNLLDAAGSFAAAVYGFGADPDLALAGLAGFRGTRRRFEQRGEAGGVRIIDDYAHNPPKVAALLEAAWPLKGDGRLVVVYEPHLFSRTRDFAEEFGQALAPADVVLLMETFGGREDPIPGVTSRFITERVVRRGADGSPTADQPYVEYLPPGTDAAAALAAMVRPGDLVLTVGSQAAVAEVPARLLDLLGEGSTP